MPINGSNPALQHANNDPRQNTAWGNRKNWMWIKDCAVLDSSWPISLGLWPGLVSCPEIILYTVTIGQKDYYRQHFAVKAWGAVVRQPEQIRHLLAFPPGRLGRHLMDGKPPGRLARWCDDMDLNSEACVPDDALTAMWRTETVFSPCYYYYCIFDRSGILVNKTKTVNTSPRPKFNNEC